MTITYRGVSQLKIAESLERLAMTLLTLDVGPLTTEAAEFWIAQDGVAAHIRRASTKAEIAAALEMKTPQSNFTATGWLSELYNNLLPNLFVTDSSAGQKVALHSVIQSVKDWNGFYSNYGRFHILLPEDEELRHYHEEKLGLSFHEKSRFKSEAFKGPYNAYQVYTDISTVRAIQALHTYAKANDLEDEFVGQDYDNKGPVYATENFARLALRDVAVIQAFGHDNKLMSKGTTEAPRPPQL